MVFLTVDSLSDAHCSSNCTILLGSRFLSRRWPWHPVSILSFPFLTRSLGIRMEWNPIAISSKSLRDITHSKEDRKTAANSVLWYQGQAMESWTHDENADSLLEPPHSIILSFLWPQQGAAACLLTAPIPLTWWLGSLAGNSPAALLAFLRKETAGQVHPLTFPHMSLDCCVMALEFHPSLLMGCDLGGTGSGAGIEHGLSAPPFAAVHVSCQASVPGWLQSFPHQCLAGASRRTFREVRLLLYLAMWSIASWHAASALFQDIYLQGNKITWLQFKLARCAIFSLLPQSRIACHLCLSTPASRFSPMPILGASSFTNLLAPKHGSFVHLATLVFAVFLSEQQSHFNTAAFCKIYKNSLSCRSWRDDENVDSQLEPPQSINNFQERMID